jgi:hypothetical protein
MEWIHEFRKVINLTLYYLEFSVYDTVLVIADFVMANHIVDVKLRYK